MYEMIIIYKKIFESFVKINMMYSDINETIYSEYKVTRFIEGHSKNTGCQAGIIKNPIWVIEEDDKEYLLMYCKLSNLVKLCRFSYQKILDYEKEIDKKQHGILEKMGMLLLIQKILVYTYIK